MRRKPRRKKNEAIAMVIEEVRTVQRQTGRSCRASYQRWTARLREEKPLVQAPGPKKDVQLDLPLLLEEVQQMKHRGKRSFGTGRLYEAHRQEISRRHLHRLVKEERCRLKAERRRSLRRITWHVPGLVWAIDGTEIGDIQVLHMQDLASHYKFDPQVDVSLPGEQVAAYLEQVIALHGPPLILKRDRGSNLRHAAVQALLEKHLIIPLDSPGHYPPYNGAIEHAQGEIKGTHRVGPALAGVALECHSAAAQTLNHRRRPSLQGRTACAVFGQARQALQSYTRQKRKEVIDWIKQQALAILQGGGSSNARAHEKAWRRAVESWLHREGLITVKVDGKVLPYFPPTLVSRSGR
jgi:hypothetical protein